MPVSARTGSPRRPARRPRGRMRPRVHEGELQLKLQLEVIHKGAEARQLTCAVHRRAALWDLGRSFLDGGRCALVLADSVAVLIRCTASGRDRLLIRKLVSCWARGSA